MASRRFLGKTLNRFRCLTFRLHSREKIQKGLPLSASSKKWPSEGSFPRLNKNDWLLNIEQMILNSHYSTNLQMSLLCGQWKGQCWNLVWSHCGEANQNRHSLAHWAKYTYLFRSYNHLEVGMNCQVTLHRLWLCHPHNWTLVFLQILANNQNLMLLSPAKKKNFQR